MLTELSRERFMVVRHLFDPLAFNTEVPSILDGNTKGRIFVDTPEAPTVALIWDGLIGLFLAGNFAQAGFNRSLQAWFDSEPIPLAQSYGMEELALTYAPDTWTARLPQLLSHYRLTLEPRHYYTHTGVRTGQRVPDAGTTLHPVTADLLSREDLQGREWLEGWIMSYWPTLEAYLSQGIGYVAVTDEHTVASLCISVFAADKALEFGTATHPAYRNRGLSTATAGACVNACLARGVAPVWHCWHTNAPSIAVARKVGFRLEREYTIYKLWVPNAAS